MRLVTIDSRDLGGRPGLWLPAGEILDLMAAPGSLRATQRLPGSVVSILAEGPPGRERLQALAWAVSGASGEERERWRGDGVLLPEAGTQLLAPIRRPALVLVLEPGATPVLKNPHAIGAPGRQLRLPPGEDSLDLRPHLAMVLGRPLYQADVAQVRAALSACTLMLEFGRNGAGGLFQGAHFPGACPLGPALLLIDGLEALESLELALGLNGQPAARSAALGQDRDPAGEIAQLSAIYGLRPGDIIAFPARLPRPLRAGPGDSISIALGSSGLVLQASVSREARLRH
ncbi:MAG: fumarylacetoacetate hydrolase family protein [Chromatiales bacterium]|nr:fumarylacetoacetate hydrolase family protein [Chromatiales bacterium]